MSVARVLQRAISGANGMVTFRAAETSLLPVPTHGISPAWRSSILSCQSIRPTGSLVQPTHAHGTSWRGESSDRAPLTSSSCTSMSSTNHSFTFSSHPSTSATISSPLSFMSQLASSIVTTSSSVDMASGALLGRGYGCHASVISSIPVPYQPWRYRPLYDTHETATCVTATSKKSSMNSSSARHTTTNSNSSNGKHTSSQSRGRRAAAGAGAGASASGRSNNGHRDNSKNTNDGSKGSYTTNNGKGGKNRRLGRVVASATLGIWSIDSGARPEDFHAAYGPPSPPLAAHQHRPTNNINTNKKNTTSSNGHNWRHSNGTHHRRHSDDDVTPSLYNQSPLLAATTQPSARRIRLSTSPPSHAHHHHGNGVTSTFNSPLYGGSNAPLSADTSASPLRLLLDHLRQRGGERHVNIPHVSSSSSTLSNTDSSGSSNDGFSTSSIPSGTPSNSGMTTGSTGGISCTSSPRIHHVPRVVRHHSNTSPSWLSLGTPAWSQAAATPSSGTSMLSDSPKASANLHMAPAFVVSPPPSTSSTTTSGYARINPPLGASSPPPMAPAFVPLANTTKRLSSGMDTGDMKRTLKPLGRSHSSSIGNNSNSNNTSRTSMDPISKSRSVSTGDNDDNDNGDAGAGSYAPLTAAEAERRARADPSTATAFDAFRSKVHVDDDGKLSLSHYDLSMPHTWKALGYFLMASPNVRSLRLDGMDISEEEATMLGKGVLRQIKHIAFCGNNIGMTEGSMEIIVGILLLCEYLESAAFQRNSLDDAAMPHIARLISEHVTLSSLDLSLNGIADNGARHIALALSNLKYSFAKINLSFNFIGVQGREKLLAAQAAQRQATGRFVAIELTGNDPVAAFLQAKSERDSLRESIMNQTPSASVKSTSPTSPPLASPEMATVMTLIPSGTPPNGKAVSPPPPSSSSLAIGSNTNKSGGHNGSNGMMNGATPQSPMIAPVKRQDPPAALRGGLLGGTIGPFGALRAHRAPLARQSSNGSGANSAATSPVLVPRSAPQAIPTSTSSSPSTTPTTPSLLSTSSSSPYR